MIDANLGHNGTQINKNLLKENISLKNSLENHLNQFESMKSKFEEIVESNKSMAVKYEE
jgi:hypothetical protein